MAVDFGEVSTNPGSLPYRTVGEWVVQSGHPYSNPFADVAVVGTFTAPSGAQLRVPGFYDGDGMWRVRFNPGEEGHWRYTIHSNPTDPELAAEGEVEVMPRSTRGFLRATPGRAWGFEYENGEPVFLFGDTTYNLFGMAYCGADVGSFLERRARQGFNLLRVRLPVSPFHPPDGYSDWQTRRTWPWGGSEQAPLFDRFNLDYFAVVDRVVRVADELGLGFEMIMEGWGFEFPFNNRGIFVPEWEELWMRYLIARYDAFASTCFWTPLNEYEFYPNGDWNYKPVADRWAMRVARWIKGESAHGHILSMHNGPTMPPFAERFAADPDAVDAIMFQTWGTVGEHDAWLAVGIEDRIDESLGSWRGSAVFAEWGYERNPEFELKIPGHLHCDPEHTRRGAWRGAFRSLGIIHGWENSWGPWQVLDRDQAGMPYLLHLRRFLTEVVPFHQLRPAPQLHPDGEFVPGHRPMVMSTADHDVVAAYLPVGGTLTLPRLPDGGYASRWFDPRTGELRPTETAATGATYSAPEGGDAHPWDWALVLSREGGGAS